jgi:hypothetical protein
VGAENLKHRAAHETRTIPIPPDLARLLRAHIRRYGTTPDGRVFLASVTLSRTAVLAISAPALPARLPREAPGRRSGTQGSTPDSAAHVKPETPPVRPVRGRPWKANGGHRPS